jgi:hypothetical protein
MTQAQTTVVTQVDEQSIAKSELEPQYFNHKARADKSSDEDFYFQTLGDATETILRHAFWLAKQKQKRPVKEYRKLLVEQGWKGEEKKYLKIAEAFGKFKPEDLAQIDPRTIYQLAEHSKKYQPVIDQLLDLAQITQIAVRELIQKQRQPRKVTSEKPSIWRRTNNGGRYCQIPPIHESDEQTGITLQKMMDEEGLLPQAIVREAIALRQAYKEGRLVFVE